MKKEINLNTLNAGEKNWLLALQKENKEYRNYNIKNLVICSTIELAIAGLTLCLSKPFNYAFPIFRDEVTYYSNDEITYSSLDDSSSILEKDDDLKLKEIDKLEILKSYSPWKKDNGSWTRIISSYEITPELNLMLKELYRNESLNDNYLEVIENVVPSIKIETVDTEPKEKEGYIEYKMIDDASYLAKASLNDYMPSLLMLFNSFLIIIGCQHVVRKHYEKDGLVTVCEYRENKEELEKLLKKLK